MLLPETWAAVRAAHANRLQSSLNLALGSALSSIGLTIPAVAVTSMVVGLPQVMGLDSKELVLLVLTFAGRVDHPGFRSHPRIAGRRAPRDLRGVCVPGLRSLGAYALSPDSASVFLLLALRCALFFQRLRRFFLLLFLPLHTLAHDPRSR